MLNSAAVSSLPDNKELNPQHLSELLHRIWKRKRLPTMSIMPIAILRHPIGPSPSLERQNLSSKHPSEVLENSLELLKHLQEFLMAFNRAMSEVDRAKPKHDFLPTLFDEIFHLIADVIAVECAFVAAELSKRSVDSGVRHNNAGEFLSIHHIVLQIASLLLDRIADIENLYNFSTILLSSFDCFPGTLHSMLLRFFDRTLIPRFEDPAVKGGSLNNYYCSFLQQLLARVLFTVDIYINDEDLIFMTAISKRMANAQCDFGDTLLYAAGSGDDNAALRAMWILFRFYPNSFGHLLSIPDLKSLNTEFSHPLDETHLTKPMILVEPPKDSINEDAETRDDINRIDWSMHSLFPAFFIRENMPLHCVVCNDKIIEYGIKCNGCRDFGLHIDCMAKYNPDLVSIPKNYVGVDFSAKNSQHSFVPCNTFALTLCCSCELPLWGVFTQGEQCIRCGDVFHSKCAKKTAKCSGSKRSTRKRSLSGETFHRSLINFYDEIIEVDIKDPSKDVERDVDSITVTFQILRMQEAMIYNGFKYGKVQICGTDCIALERNALKTLSSGFVAALECIEKHLADSDQLSSSFLFDFVKNSSVQPVRSMIRQLKLEVGNTGEAVLEFLKARISSSRISSLILLQYLLNSGILRQFDSNYSISLNLLGYSDLKISLNSDPYHLMAAVERCLLSTENLALNECALKLIERRLGWNFLLDDEHILRRVFDMVIFWSAFNVQDFFRKTAKMSADQFCKEISLTKTKCSNLEIDLEDMQFSARSPVDFSHIAGSSIERRAFIKARAALIKSYVNPWLTETQKAIGLSEFQNLYWLALSSDVGDYRTDSKERFETCFDRIQLLQKACVRDAHNHTYLLKWLDELKLKYYLPTKKLPQSVKECIVKALSTIPVTTDHNAKSRKWKKVSDNSNYNSEMQYLYEPSENIHVILENFRESLEDSTKWFDWIDMIQDSGVLIPQKTIEGFISELGQRLSVAPASSQNLLMDQLLRILYILAKSSLYQPFSGNFVLETLERTICISKHYLNNLSGESIVSSEVKLQTKIIQLVEIILLLVLQSAGCDKYLINLNGVSYKLKSIFASHSSGRNQFTITLNAGWNFQVQTSLVDLVIIPALKFIAILVVSLDNSTFAKAIFDCRILVLNVIYIILKEDRKFESVTKLVEAIRSMCIPVIWGMLGSARDSSGDWIIDLLFLLEVRFSSNETSVCCVDQILQRSKLCIIVMSEFESLDWEIRFLALDPAFGLISKLSKELVDGNQNILWYVGSVVTFIIVSLGDEEEAIRVKSMTLFRSLDGSHLRFMLQCWGSLFTRCSNPGLKSRILNQMIALNSYFPSLVVLGWDQILEAAEQKKLRDCFCFRQHYSPEIIEDQLRNLSVLAVSLALQMLGTGVEIKEENLFELKLIIARQLCFDFSLINDGDKRRISLGMSNFDASKQQEQTFLICLCRGLKRVFDKYHVNIQFSDGCQNFQNSPRETNPIQSAIYDHLRYESELFFFFDALTQAVGSPKNFSAMDLTASKAWLDVILVFIYKFEIDDDQIKDSVISCMTLLLETLESFELSEECKIAVISIFTALMKRGSKSSYVLMERQIRCVADLIIHTRGQKSYQLYIKAKSFIHQAFQTFGDSGLFVILFKQCEWSESTPDFSAICDYFLQSPLCYVLENIGNNSWSVTGSIMKKILLFKELDQQSFCYVILNTAAYLATIRPNIDIESAENICIFLEDFISKTFEWRRRTWDVSAILILCSTLLTYRQHRTTIFPKAAKCILHCVRRAIIRLPALSMMKVTIIAMKDLNDTTDGFLRNLLEETALMIKNTPKSPETLYAMLEFLKIDFTDDSSLFKELLIQRNFHFEILDFLVKPAEYPDLFKKTGLIASELLLLLLSNFSEPQIRDALQSNESIDLTWILAASILSDSKLLIQRSATQSFLVFFEELSSKSEISIKKIILKLKLCMLALSIYAEYFSPVNHQCILDQMGYQFRGIFHKNFDSENVPVDLLVEFMHFALRVSPGWFRNELYHSAIFLLDGMANTESVKESLANLIILASSPIHIETDLPRLALVIVDELEAILY